MTNPVNNNQDYTIKLTNKNFNQLSSFINLNFGIKLPEVKKIMLQSRLQKRLKELNLTSFQQYCDYLFSSEGQKNEVVNMIDVVSTNKTDFFREPVHFDFLANKILKNYTNTTQNIFKIWSAGCSSGEEPYSLAIILNEFAQYSTNFQYSIFATDISTIVLKKSVSAIYNEDKSNLIPLNLKRKYLLKNKDHNKKNVRIIKDIRQKVKFERLNFMDKRYNVNEMFDCVFCRNTLIYFKHEIQEDVINKLCMNLKTGGYFFLGHSESITNMNVPLKQIQPTIFIKI
ncbi:MAG: chemotaxis protein CheR [Bacteroidetes bacterium]|nr:chemotaxis protein CheR [Bacteroidota bacterium]